MAVHVPSLNVFNDPLALMPSLFVILFYISHPFVKYGSFLNGCELHAVKNKDNAYYFDVLLLLESETNKYLIFRPTSRVGKLTN
jgi:hypothetical protein